MSDERPIEKLLRRYAKKRSDDAGSPELHPATRRLLQGEVARQYPKGRPGEKLSFLTLLREWTPWLVGSVAIITLTGVCYWMTVGGQQSEQRYQLAKSDSTKNAELTLAQNQPTPEPPQEKAKALKTDSYSGVDADDAKKQVATLSVADQPAPALRPEAVADAGSSAARETDSRRSRSLKDTVALGGESQAANRRQYAPAPGAAGAIESAKPVTAESPAAASAPVPAPTVSLAKRSAAPATPPPASNVFKSEGAFARQKEFISRGGGLERDRNNSVPEIRQAYAAMTPVESRTDKSFDRQPSSPVLLNFQVAQEGSRVVVIDNDGSIYRGEVAPTSTSRTAGSPMKLPEDDAAAAGRAVDVNGNFSQYFYRVSGTNQTLKQRVVFQWNYVASTNAADVANELKKAENINAPFPQQRLAPAKANINGLMEVQGTQREVNAVPVLQ